MWDQPKVHRGGSKGLSGQTAGEAQPEQRPDGDLETSILL